MVAREHRLKEALERLGLDGVDELTCINAKISTRNDAYIDALYGLLQRNGAMRRDCQRMVNQDRNIFAASMVRAGDADAMVTGTTRSFKSSFDHITRVIGPKPDTPFMAFSIVVSRGTTVFIGDTSVHERPDPDQVADIAEGLAAQAKAFGHTPRVAILSFSNFGSPWMKTARAAHEAVSVLDQRGVSFEYDGEMTADVALNYDLMRQNYPFCRLSGPANVLIMPGLHSANIAYKLLRQIGGGSTIGPIITGAAKPFQVVPMGASVNDIVQAAAIAVHESLG